MTNGTTAGRVREALLGGAARLVPRRRGARVAAMAVLVALAAGGAYGVHAWAARSAGTDQLTVATVQRGDLEDTVTATGTLQPGLRRRRHAGLRAARRSCWWTSAPSSRRGSCSPRSTPRSTRPRSTATRRSCSTSRRSSPTSRRSSRSPSCSSTRQQNLMRENATTADALQSAEAARKSAAGPDRFDQGADAADASRRCAATRRTSATPRSMRRLRAPSSRRRPSRARR